MKNAYIVNQDDVDNELLNNNKRQQKRFNPKVFIPLLLVAICLIVVLVFVFLPVKGLSQQMAITTMDTSTLVEENDTLESGKSYICELTCDLKNNSFIDKSAEIKIKLTNANVADLQDTFENIEFSDFVAQKDCVIGKINIDVTAFSKQDIALKFNFYPFQVTITTIEVFVSGKQIIDKTYLVELL